MLLQCYGHRLFHVCVWSIWIDQDFYLLCDQALKQSDSSFSVSFQFSQGCAAWLWAALNEATTIMGYWVWSTQRTCIYHFSFRYGMWLTREPPCRLQQFAFFNLSIFNQFTALRSILTGELQSISELTTLLSDPFWPGVLFCFARTIHSKSTIR